MPSVEEARPEDSEVGSFITQAEVTEHLKSLDLVGLPLLTCLCSIVVHEEQCSFHPGHGTLDQLYNLTRVLYTVLHKLFIKER